MENMDLYSASKKALRARELFLSGANCAQAVLGAFAQECGLDLETALRMASGFGGGFARMREVCGTVSGMYLVMNLLYGYSDLQDKKIKDAHYCRLRRLADLFKKETSSVICRELLALGNGEDNAPESTPRTALYYQKRPCAELAALSAWIVEREIQAERQKDQLVFKPVKEHSCGEVAALWDSLKGTPYCLWDEFYPTLKEAQCDCSEDSLYGMYAPDGVLAAAGTVKHLSEHDSIAPWQGKNPCDLLRIGVDRFYQGKGVAARFLDELIRAAASRGFDSMRILVGRENIPALKLYQNIHAEARGEHFSWNTHWICMEKIFS